MPEIGATVIGGGIVGCAVAEALARRGISTVLLEKDDGLARGTTSRNSEVAHGGMYYPTGSRKARCCVHGRRMLKKFCESAGVAYRECGKLIVAASGADTGELERLYELGRANGVEDLHLVDGQELRRLEPDVRAVAALVSPRTGILDAEGAARAYAAAAAEHGAQIVTGAPVTGLVRTSGGWNVEVGAGGRREGWTHESMIVVNAAGLFSDRIAQLAGVDIAARGWRLVYSKGNYFRIHQRDDSRPAVGVKHLVYPVPPADGSSLGTHVCLDLGGGLRLGPDVEVLERPHREPELLAESWDYRVDESRADFFHRDVGAYLPWLERDDLGPDQCGIRPKLAAAGFRDFVLERETGPLAGLINLIGIDSPGLTSAPALADETAGLAAEILE